MTLDQLTEDSASQTRPVARTLSRKQYVLVPLVSLATIVLMLGVAEIVARMGWPEHTYNPCIKEDSIHVYHATPNCDATTKIAEGPWVNYHFNACGYRTNDACGAKPAGVIRIALVGSSIPEGLHVRFEQTVGARTAEAISKATGRKVQLENLGLSTLMPVYTYRRLPEAINLHPDVVIWPVAPFDVAEPLNRQTLSSIENHQPIHLKELPPKPNTLMKKIQNLLNDNVRASLVAQHFLFANPNTLVHLLLGYGERAAYLRNPTSPKWEEHYADFNLILTKVAANLHQAGIPLILVAVPSREEAALLSVSPRPPQTDPFDFDRRLAVMAAQLNIGFVDSVQEFAREPHSDRHFYYVDLHPDGEGHALIARALVRKCLDGSIPAITEKQSN